MSRPDKPFVLPPRYSLHVLLPLETDADVSLTTFLLFYYLSALQALFYFLIERCGFDAEASLTLISERRFLKGFGLEMDVSFF